MPEESISCPKCGASIALTEAITHTIEGKLREQFDADGRRRDKEWTQKLAQQKADLEITARTQAAEALAVQFKDLQSQLAEKSARLDESRTQELELRKRQRELEERAKTLDLQLERKLAEGQQGIEDKALERFDEQHRLTISAKEKQISEMREQIEALKRKAEQGSQKTQGEVFELDLEAVLQTAFRHDQIEPVASGKRGADILHRVNTDGGRGVGTILWEAKNTKAWSDTWLPKIKDDQRAEKADFAVIVSEVLPRDVKRFGFRDGVWITEFSCAGGLATALREQLVALSQTRQAQQGKSTKMKLVYEYLSGPGFRQRVEAIIEAFDALKEDLESEKRAMERIWAKREMQIQRVLNSTAGMYGDFQGIVGSTLPDVEVLRLPEGPLLRLPGMEHGEVG